jgi:hypothetical protein
MVTVQMVATMVVEEAVGEAHSAHRNPHSLSLSHIRNTVHPAHHHRRSHRSPSRGVHRKSRNNSSRGTAAAVVATKEVAETPEVTPSVGPACPGMKIWTPAPPSLPFFLCDFGVNVCCGFHTTKAQQTSRGWFTAFSASSTFHACSSRRWTSPRASVRRAQPIGSGSRRLAQALSRGSAHADAKHAPPMPPVGQRCTGHLHAATRRQSSGWLIFPMCTWTRRRRLVRLRLPLQRIAGTRRSSPPFSSAVLTRSYRAKQG